MDPLSEYQEKVRRYEDRGGPVQGYRGAYAHLDPVEPAPAPDPAYAKWAEVSGRVLNTTADPEMLEVIRAASAAMAELHDEIARLEREKAS